MKINIYYGGRGMIDDPTLVVINKMQEVLEELHVKVERYNLHELKNTIPTLPQTLKDVDGVIFATTVEWHGIGGYMHQFLDACWLYGDKEKISQIYMCPIVMSTTYGEREGKLDLSTAWEILGGLPCSGICGYIADSFCIEGLYPPLQVHIELACLFPSSDLFMFIGCLASKSCDLIISWFIISAVCCAVSLPVSFSLLSSAVTRRGSHNSPGWSWGGTHLIYLLPPFITRR